MRGNAAISTWTGKGRGLAVIMEPGSLSFCRRLMDSIDPSRTDNSPRETLSVGVRIASHHYRTPLGAERQAIRVK